MNKTYLYLSTEVAIPLKVQPSDLLNQDQFTHAEEYSACKNSCIMSSSVRQYNINRAISGLGLKSVHL